MKIYVAAKFEEAPFVKTVMQTLRDQGHEITHDWTVKYDNESKLSEEDKVKCAEQGLRGVVECDLLLLFPHDLGEGLYTEFGVSLGLNKRIVCVGAVDKLPNNIFFKLDKVIKVPDLNTAYLAIYFLDLMSGNFTETLKFFTQGPQALLEALNTKGETAAKSDISEYEYRCLDPLCGDCDQK